MRPLRLELEGFASFREHTVVDFADAELFVLTGPTGAGKSSIIDAMTFALYGAVPRYNDLRLVRHVISRGKAEARVRLDFAIDDAVYTAVRIVRRTRTGAATAEARLERGEETIAGGAADMDRAVVDVLGLQFEHFQKCVVLPQGAFAQLLHDDHRNRLALLRRLLDIEVFERMGQLANLRRSDAERRGADIDARLANELALATPEPLAAANARVDRLQELLVQLRESQLTIDQVAADIETLKRGLVDQESAASLLATIARPSDAAGLTSAVREAATTVAQAEAALKAAEETSRSADDAVAALPSAAEVEVVLRTHAEARDLAARMEATRDGAEAAQAYVDRARAAEERSRSELERAESKREAVLKENYAYRVAVGLQPGDICPICGRPLARPPDLSQPSGLPEVDARRKEAAGALDEASKAVKGAERELTQLLERLTGIEARHRECASALDGKPDETQAASLLEAVAVTARARDEATAHRREAAARADAARARHAEAERALGTNWQRFDEARDTVARLGPPAADRADLGAAWDGLLAWAHAESQSRQLALTVLVGQRDGLVARRAELLAARRQLCLDVDVPVGDTDIEAAATSVLAEALSRRDTIQRDIETAARLGQERKQYAESEAVARDLARYLRADRHGFEAWYVRRIVQQLAKDASRTLLKLSREQYSLALNDEQQFEVVDHANADEHRFIRTLSGGETFLASLALALALAESIASFAAGRTARLDAIFLDEGFGTLDPETLDVVATAMEELSAGGRMVGLVTHVPELAARIPTRYEVSKGPAGSTVVRVDS